MLVDFFAIEAAF